MYSGVVENSLTGRMYIWRPFVKARVGPLLSVVRSLLSLFLKDVAASDNL